MINGAHAIIYSKSAEADRAFLSDVLGLPSVDVGGGWLIYGLPPSEVAVHPTDGDGGTHELYLMCENIDVFVAAMASRGIACSEVQNQGWGMLANVTLPGGSQLGVYQPRHARPPVMGAEPVTLPAKVQLRRKAKAATKPQPKEQQAKKPQPKKPRPKKPQPKKPRPKKAAPSAKKKGR